MATQPVCEAALDKHEKRLNKLPNVIGLGIVSLDEDDIRSPKLGIAVYVERKVPEKELSPSQRVPKFVRIRLGKRLRNVYTRVIEQGPVRLEVDDENDGIFRKESL